MAGGDVMEGTMLFELSIFVGIIGILIVMGLVYAGWRVFKQEFEQWLRWWVYDPSHPGTTPDVASVIGEYLSRRNEFWTGTGQFAVSILVVVVLTILLLAKVITAEAGLPILAGVGGFAIGKGVQTGRTLTSGSPRG
jgi:hypothetical protein